MDDKIVKNYYLEKNFFLENYNELTNATIASLYQNYLFLRIMPFCNFDNEKDEEDGDDEELNQTYKYLLGTNAVLQGELLTYLCIFMALKNLNKEFTKAILEKAVTSVDPDLTQLVQVIIDTLNNNTDNDNANMYGGAPVGSLISKAIILLLLLANVSIQTKGQDADFNPYDLVAEVRNEDVLHGEDLDVKTFTMKEPVEQESIKQKSNVNAKPFGSQVSTFGNNQQHVLSDGFEKEQQRQAEIEQGKLIIADPIFGYAKGMLTIKTQTKEEILKELKDKVYDLNTEFSQIYQKTTENCKALITATKDAKYLNPDKFQPSNSTDTAKPDDDDDDDDETNQASSFNDIINYTTAYLNPFEYFSSTSTPPKDTDINDTTSSDNTTSENNINIVNEQNSKTYGLAAINIKNTNKLSVYKAQENIEKEAIIYCETVFNPAMVIDKYGSQDAIYKSISGHFLLQDTPENAADIQNNILTPFDKFVPNLIAIKEKIKTDLKNGKYSPTGEKYAKLHDISEKVEILLEIIEKSKEAVFFFGNKAQFNNKMGELEEAKQQIIGLNALFQEDNPVSFRKGVLEKQREAKALKQKSAQEQVIHEGELEVGQEELERREENLDLAKNVTKIAQAEVKNAVDGTFGVGTAAMGQAFENAGDAAVKGAEQIAKTTNVLIGPAAQILRLVGGGLGLYVVYMCLNGASVISPIMRIFTRKSTAATTAAATTNATATTTTTSTAAPAAQPGQQEALLTIFGRTNGLVTLVDMQQNTQTAGFFGVYYENVTDTIAARLENIRRYYESRTDNNYVILYNEPPSRYKLCGRYAGIHNNNVLIDLPDNNIIEKAVTDILDPILNDYYAPINQPIVTRCMQAFNMNNPAAPAIAGPAIAAPAIAAVPPVAQGNVNTNAYNEELADYQGDDDDDNSSIASEATTVSEDVDNEQLSRGGKTKSNRKNRRKHKTVKKNKKRKNKTIKKVKKNHRKTYKKK